MAKDVNLPEGFVLDAEPTSIDLPEGFVLDTEPVPANPMGDATPAQVIRNAAMGRIDRGQAEAYLSSVGLDPAAIDRFGQKNMSATRQVQGAFQQYVNGALSGFGDEIAAGMTAAIAAAASPDITVSDAYPVALEDLRQNKDAYQIQHPAVSTGLNIAGIATQLGAMRNVAPGIQKGIADVSAKGAIPSMLTSGGIGALSGSLYGFGEGEGGVRARAAEAGDVGLLGGLGGAAGAAVFRAAGPLTEKARRLFGKPAASAAPTAIAQPLASTEMRVTRKPANVVAQLQDSTQGLSKDLVDTTGMIPLTKGQATQNQKLQSLENMARAGALDDASQAAIYKADYAQQDAIKKSLGALAGGEASEEALGNAAGLLKGGYRGIKAQVAKAYDNADVIRNVFVDKKPIAEAFSPRIKDIAYKSGFDMTNMSKETQDLIKQVDAIKDPKISALNLEKMEFWRRKLTNRAEQMKGDPEGVMLNKVVGAYDDFMSKLPAEALKSGDESALKAIADARSLRKRQGVLFEREKVISQIVKDDSLTNEQLANLVLTGSSAGQNIGPSAGRYVRAMKRAAGDNATELTDNLRKGVFARMLNKSMTNQLRAGTDVQMISPNKLLKELDGLSRNTSFKSEIFDPAQIEAIDQLRGSLRKIVSEQPGSKNYSNTAYAIINMLRSMPFGISGLSNAASVVLKPIAEKGARDTLIKDLAPGIGEVQSELVGKSKAYGAYIGGALAGGSKSSAQAKEDQND
jgi:hypothetical protein